jgi:hypothetical protein
LAILGRLADEPLSNGQEPAVAAGAGESEDLCALK